MSKQEITPDVAAEVLATLRECRAALDALLKARPMLAATIAGSTTLGNLRVEVGAVLKRATAPN